MPSETHLKRKAWRIGHRRFIEEVYRPGKYKVGKIEAKEAIYDYICWIFYQLTQGQRVHLYRLGSFGYTFRKGRTSLGRFQPDQYVVKVRPSRYLKAAMRELAKKYPDPKTLPANRTGDKTKPWPKNVTRYGAKPEVNNETEMPEPTP